MRIHVTLLVALSALLVLDGGPPLRDLRGDAGDAPVVLGEAEVAARVRSLNPLLTPTEERRIAAAVVKYAAKYELDPSLVLAVMEAESTARPWARSPKGAVGLMQVMPYTMAPLDIAGSPTSIESNIEAGCLILSDNIRRLGEERGILAYFWGNDIRGVAYLERVREARAALLRAES